MAKKREIEESAIVITGASSGIGRATAHRVAEQGADVVLAARSERDLELAAEECERAGARAHVVPTDVTEDPAVRRSPKPRRTGSGASTGG